MTFKSVIYCFHFEDHYKHCLIYWTFPHVLVTRVHFTDRTSNSKTVYCCKGVSNEKMTYLQSSTKELLRKDFMVK